MYNSEDTVLVEVEGEPITLTMLELQLELRDIKADDIDGMRRTLEDMIRVLSVARRGDREGISARPKVRAERRLRDIEVRYEQFLEAYSAQHTVSDEDIQEVYNLQRERAGPYRYRLETIEFPNQGSALSTLDSLNSGEIEFDEAIEQASQSGRTARRTDWIDGSQVPPAFAEILAESEPGTVLNQLLPYQNLWLIVRIANREAFTPPTLSEVSEGIRRTLLRRRAQEMIDTTRAAADVVPILPLKEGGADDTLENAQSPETAAPVEGEDQPST